MDIYPTKELRRHTINHPASLKAVVRGVEAHIWAVSSLVTVKTSVFQADSVSGVCYCTKILLTQVYLFRSAVNPDFLHDNPTTHFTLAVVEFLQSEDI